MNNDKVTYILFGLLGIVALLCARYGFDAVRDTAFTAVSLALSVACPVELIRGRHGLGLLLGALALMAWSLA